ncbi:hypothetical protein [Arenimonas oryziterrae]|uniref:Uncharacterized protein n=1 Tax=Arenimonas oryziterrae DSM 21050 = YC6267 TaxID=1121015 RepID=A0A091AT33_9GAMM|nr:hypothetical protein [Arenimonas oryziterrae]KFN43353.1 hypothetical protein N789_08750 [Arenimonas oryziterrae DSM 21050 = YC6267]
MSRHTLCFTGFSRDEAAAVQSQFEQIRSRLGSDWAIEQEADAQVLVIDMDSMYGHMTWLKAHNSGKTTVGLTAGSRSETDHVLTRPLSNDALIAVLEQIAGQIPTATVQTDALAARITGQQAAMPPVSPRSTGQQPAMPPRPAEPAPAPVSPRTTGQMPAMGVDPVRTTGQMPAMPAREPALADFLRNGALAGPVKLQLPGAPLLVLDPGSQTYLGGTPLKVFQPYAEAVVRADDFTAIDAGELKLLSGQLGGAQPFSRLAWLCALVGGKGVIAPGYDPNAQYKLVKWPQTEREFAKHFRIATVMMKGPARLTEIAEQSGVPLAEVTDFVNANLASGYAATS